jgi:hydroxymethylpyrimidine pyrophosphatase-like HAD family hydrolase
LKKFLFVDLDDTLFQTSKKCQGHVDLQPVAFLKDGAPISFMNHKQRALFDMFAREMTLIPATARNLDAFSRVDLPFCAHAIIDYGGVILLPDRQPDQAWLAHTQQQMVLAHEGLQAVLRLIDEYAIASGMAGRARMVEDFGVPFYALIKDPHGIETNLAQIEAAVLQPWVAGSGRDYYIHRNGNNLALLPNSLNKAHAVNHLQAQFRREFEHILSFGMGDSRSDATFMAACDYALLPQLSQLGTALRALPGLATQ